MVNAESIFEVIQRYFTDEAVVVLAAAALLFLLKSAEKKYKRYALLLGFIALLVFSDLGYKVIMKIGEEDTFYRFLWILPVTVLSGYLIIEIWSVLSKGTQKIAYIVIIFIVIFVNYKPSFGNWVSLPENIYQVSNEQIEAARIIKKYKRKWRMKFWDDGTISDGLREYDGSVMIELEPTGDMYSMLNNEVINEKGSNVQAALCNAEIDVLGVKKEHKRAQKLFEGAGCTKIGETESSYLYYFDWRSVNKRQKDLEQYYSNAILDINEEYIVTDHLESTYEILYLTDMNIDLMNNQYLNENNVSAAEQFEAWIQMANDYGVDAVLLGGNMLNSYSENNIEFFKEQLSMLEMPYLYIHGENDVTDNNGICYSEENDPYGLFEVTDTKSQMLELDELRLCTIGDSDFQRMAEIVRSESPAILMTHIPLLDKKNTEMLNVFFQEETSVVELLAGNIGTFDKSLLNDKVVQYVGNAAYKGSGTLFVVTGE